MIEPLSNTFGSPEFSIFFVQAVLSSMLIIFYSITQYEMIKIKVYNELAFVCILLIASNFLWLICDGFDWWLTSLGQITPITS